MATESQQDSLERVSCRTYYVRGLSQVLHAMKTGTKQQVCSMSLASDGITLRWEDDSKTLQCSVYLKSELFSDYSCPPEMHCMFGLQLNLLLDVLSVYASALSTSSLQLKYPGPQGELVCQMECQSYGVPMVTYSRLGAVEVPASQDLTDYWQSPDSYFLIQGSMLKEAVEDLEWPGGDVDILMSQDQQRLALSASGSAGDLTVDIPVSELNGFYVAPVSQQGPQGTEQLSELCYRYRYKALRAAFCNLPSMKEFGSITTKVSIDSSGLLKAMHMVCLHGPANPSQQAMTMPSTLAGDPGGTMPSDSQRPDSVRTAVLAFVTVPLLTEGDERGEAEQAEVEAGQ